MKLSLFTDIGLRTLMRLAGNPETPLATKELASELRGSRNHLTKVVARLAAGFISARRGNQGGISLASPAEQIRVGDVVSELERDTNLVDCFRADGGTCTLKHNCKLSGLLAGAEQQFIYELNQASLKDIAYQIEAANQ